jgi:hypothetical protein
MRLAGDSGVYRGCFPLLKPCISGLVRSVSLGADEIAWYDGRTGLAALGGLIGTIV